jgi:outer membrane murein-binding lipoprotein Lpp
MVGGVYTFYAFTTSTTAGSVTITSNGNASTYHVASQVGPQYNIAATFPSSLVPDGAAKVVVKLTDVFGNEIDNSNSNATDRFARNVFNNASLTVTRIGATASDTAWRYDATDKGWVLLSKDVKTGEVALRVDLANVTDRKVGFAAPITSAFKMISTASLEAQVTSLTAQVATLTASVTALKADYNKLAKRWNDLRAAKKAPKKAVATK